MIVEVDTRLVGMIAHMPSVFDAAGAISEAALRHNLRRLRESGLRAVYLMGSSGEFFNVSAEDYRRAVKVFVEEVGPHVLKIVGCGSPRLRETIETVSWLNTAGVDAVLLIPPYFVPLNSNERVSCLRNIAAACPNLGVIHYNTGYAPAVRFAPEDYRELSRVPNFWGSKQGSMTPELWLQLRDSAPGLRHLTLDDGLVWAMRAGGWGVFSLVTSFSPRFALGWYEACRAEDWERAERMDREFRDFMDEVYWPLSRRGYSDIAVDKALVDCFGVLKAGDPLPPLQAVDPLDREWAARKIAEHGFFEASP